jgi:Rap1a immunity proteins
MIRKAIALLALTLPAAAQTPAPQGAANKGTTELVSLCRGTTSDTSGKSRDAVAGLQCLRYIEGFKDGLAFARDPKFCVPSNVTLGDQVQAFLRWADDHKGPLDQTKELTLIRSFSETYPCKK